MKKMMQMFAIVAIAAMMFSKAAQADTILTASQVINTGLSTSYNTNNIVSTTTYVLTNDGRVFVHFKKSAAGSATITITPQATVQGLSLSAITVTIPGSTGDKMIGPFAPSVFNDANGRVNFTISGDTTSLSMLAIRL